MLYLTMWVVVSSMCLLAFFWLFVIAHEKRIEDCVMLMLGIPVGCASFGLVVCLILKWFVGVTP